jgi:ribonuclease HI
VEAFFTDGSERHGLIGSAVAHRNFSSHRTIGRATDLNAYFAELFAIFQAVMNIEGYAIQHPESQTKTFTIFSDSQAALQALTQPRQRSGQYLVRTIWYQVSKLQQYYHLKIQFQWVPAHCGIELNEKANEEARRATQHGSTPPQQHLPMLVTVARRLDSKTDTIRTNRIERRYFSKHIDQALPGPHTRKLYDHLNKADAGLLAQLRTGKNRLHTYLARIGARDSDKCECGREAETVAHFLVRCPRWRRQRDELQLYRHPRWGDFAFWLGAWTGRLDREGKYIDGDPKRWQPNIKAVKDILQFIRMTKRLNPE